MLGSGFAPSGAQPPSESSCVLVCVWRFRPTGPTRTLQAVVFWIVCFWTSRAVVFWTSRAVVFWTSRAVVFWTSGAVVFWTPRAVEFWTSRQLCSGRPEQLCSGRPEQLCSGRPEQLCSGRPEQLCSGRPEQLCPAAVSSSWPSSTHLLSSHTPAYLALPWLNPRSLTQTGVTAGRFQSIYNGQSRAI